MYLVFKQIDGQTVFARAQHSCIYWVLDPNYATPCYRKSTAMIIAEGIGAEIVDASEAACYC